MIKMLMVIDWHHDVEAIFIDDDKNYKVDCYVMLRNLCVTTGCCFSKTPLTYRGLRL